MVVDDIAGGEVAGSVSSLDEVASKSAEEILQPRSTTYVVERTGCRVVVDGYAYVHDAYGGNLSNAGKATGAACWPVSNLLADYLCWDCPLLQPNWALLRQSYRSNDASAAFGSERRICELGSGLGLCGIVAASLLGENDIAVLTDGDSGVVDMAHASLKQFAAAEKARNGSQVCKRSASLLQWGSEHDAKELNLSVLPRGAKGGAFDLVIASDVIYDPNVATQAAVSLASTANLLLRTEPDDSIPFADDQAGCSGRNWADTTGECIQREIRPMCVVAFENRDVSFEVLVDAFCKEGFGLCHPSPGHVDDEGDELPEGYFENIFGDRYPQPPMFCRSSICCFARARQRAGNNNKE